MQDPEKNYAFYVKSKNIEILPSEDVNDIIKQVTDSLYANYEEEMLKLRNSSGYMFDSIEGLGIHFHMIDLRRGSSYIKSPDWIRNKGATINPKNTKHNCCSLYAIVAALNHKHIAHHPERINNLIHFTPQYCWDGIEFDTRKKEWKTFERNNPHIALNILLVPYDQEDIVIQYRSKYNNETQKSGNITHDY